MILSLILLNLAGGDCVDDLRILEKDEGFSEVLGCADENWRGAVNERVTR
jgi:hypothetical protein